MLTNHFSTLPIHSLLSHGNTLAVVEHSALTQQESAIGGFVRTGLSQLNPPHSTYKSLEVWSIDDSQTINRGVTNNIAWSKHPDVLFASKSIVGAAYSDIESATTAIYEDLLDFSASSGYNHTLRFWNYLPTINQGSGDQEIYKRFCTARLKTFDAIGIAPNDYPAASAIGHCAEAGLVISVIATKQPGDHHANARQVNAFDYPRQYGPSSPSFARATSAALLEKGQLFISGTASIIGHETVHADNLTGQFEATEQNIRTLLAAHAEPKQLLLESLRVYIRHKGDRLAAERWIARAFPNVPLVITRADICREELLVEVECFCAKAQRRPADQASVSENFATA